MEEINNFVEQNVIIRHDWSPTIYFRVLDIALPVYESVHHGTHQATEDFLFPPVSEHKVEAVFALDWLAYSWRSTMEAHSNHCSCVSCLWIKETEGSRRSYLRERRYSFRSVYRKPLESEFQRCKWIKQTRWPHFLVLGPRTALKPCFFFIRRDNSETEGRPGLW